MEEFPTKCGMEEKLARTHYDKVYGKTLFKHNFLLKVTPINKKFVRKSTSVMERMLKLEQT